MSQIVADLGLLKRPGTESPQVALFLQDIKTNLLCLERI